MIRLILVRHGNTFEETETPLQIGARTDLPLTAYGKVQAQNMAKYLLFKDIHPKVIFAGNLKRQTEFAMILGAAFHLSFEKNSVLTEIDYGVWEGLSSEQIRKQWPKEYADWEEKAAWPSHLFKGSLQHHLEGIKIWLAFLRKHYLPNDTVIAITSNGLLRLFPGGKKVKTGHFCELSVSENDLRVVQWNMKPLIDA